MNYHWCILALQDFFAKFYQARHQPICLSSSAGVMLPAVLLKMFMLDEKQTQTI